MKIRFTQMAYEKGKIIVKEVHAVDDNGKFIRKINLNEAFAIAIKQTDYELNTDGF